MMSFARVLARLGLSQAEAAAALGVRLDTVKSWSSRRRAVPKSIWPEIAALAAARAVDLRKLENEIGTRTI